MISVDHALDGYPDRPAQRNIVDYPSSYHNGAGGFNFADGHAEIHRWLDARTKKNYKRDFHLTVLRRILRRIIPMCSGSRKERLERNEILKLQSEALAIRSLG